MLTRENKMRSGTVKRRTGKTVNLNIRTDKELKESVGAILHELGLNHSSVVNLLYRQIQMRKEIPFNIKIPNEATRVAIQELENGEKPNIYKNSDELFADIGV